MNARDVLHVPERSTMKRTKSSLLAFKLREVRNPPHACTPSRAACFPQPHPAASPVSIPRRASCAAASHPTDYPTRIATIAVSRRQRLRPLLRLAVAAHPRDVITTEACAAAKPCADRVAKYGDGVGRLLLLRVLHGQVTAPSFPGLAPPTPQPSSADDRWVAARREVRRGALGKLLVCGGSARLASVGV